MSFTVAIVGRPNVGKSTLYNRLVGRREAIVDNISGVTRDRKYGESYWNNKRFNVIDTGGFVAHSEDVFESAIREQVSIALEEASLILFMTDVTTGITDFDDEVANLLRRAKKKILLVVNKVDNGDRLIDASEFYGLGFKELFPLSAISGSGTGELLDVLADYIPDSETITEDDDDIADQAALQYRLENPDNDDHNLIEPFPNFKDPFDEEDESDNFYNNDEDDDDQENEDSEEEENDDNYVEDNDDEYDEADDNLGNDKKNIDNNTDFVEEKKNKKASKPLYSKQSRAERAKNKALHEQEQKAWDDEENLKKIAAEKVPQIPRFAIIGQPNVGKSSLINALVGEPRNIVTDIAGTTRDAIDTRYNMFGMDFVLVDTAGIRRKAKVHENLEFYSVMRAIKAMDEADVCLLLLDATLGVEHQDLNIFRLAVKKKKGIMILVNKWDLLEKETNTARDFEAKIKKHLEPFSDVPIIFISAKEKQRVFKAMEMAMEVYKRRKQRIATAKINEVMLAAIEKHHPPAVRGNFIQIKYVMQLPTQTPSFAFFCNHPRDIKQPYRNYLENQLRTHFRFTGVPLSLYFRQK